MANELVEYLKGRRPLGFRSRPFISRDGDFLTFYFEDADHFAERVDDILTVYRSMDGNRFVGFKLKGVAHLLDTVGDFFFHVFGDNGELLLSMLLIAGTLKTKEASALPIYQDFVEKTRTVSVSRRDLPPITKRRTQPVQPV
jgi:hypothetical protein